MELSIKGHKIRGKEVIELLEMFGGNNRYSLTGGDENQFYYILDEIIGHSYIGPDEIKGYEIFSLDDFLKKFPYKVGDKVNVWVNHEHFSGPRAELEEAEIKSMRWNSARREVAYRMKDQTGEFYKSEIKGKVNDDEKNLFHTTNEYEEIVEKSFQGGYEKCKSDIKLNGYDLPEGYHFTDENGNVIDTTKILIKKNSPTYPTTYAECCKVIGYGGIISFAGLADEEEKLYGNFIVLKRCRDAYWKIAGEQMGLGKPWKPNFTNNDEVRYGIYTTANKVEKDFCGVGDVNTILTFPTEEMRNAFYNNFKDLIESCKELL